jgi:hypothetical protein
MEFICKNLFVAQKTKLFLDCDIFVDVQCFKFVFSSRRYRKRESFCTDLNTIMDGLDRGWGVPIMVLSHNFPFKFKS